MSKPNDHGELWNDVEGDSQYVAVSGERKGLVQKDEKTIEDDYHDYIYMHPVKKKRKKKKSADGSAESNNPTHHKSHRKRKMKTWKKVLIAALCVFMALVLFALGTALVLVLKGKGDLLTDDVQIISPKGIEADIQDGGKFIVYNGVTYKYNENVTNFLFIGVDKENLDGFNEQGTGGQADVIVMMALDFKNRKLTMINIPRDTMTDVALYSVSGYYTGMERQQICLSYAYGDGKETSCNNTLASVKRIFYNIPVSTYYSLDLEGIAALNDAVGGVDVVSPETIEKFTQGQSYHLMGNDARRFVKARVQDRADASMLRNKRHQVYASAFMDKVMTSVKKEPSYALDLFNESAPYSCTNLNASKVTYIAQDIAFHGSLKTNMQTVPGDVSLNSENKAEYTVNEKDFYEQFLSVYYERM